IPVNIRRLRTAGNIVLMDSNRFVLRRLWNLFSGGYNLRLRRFRGRNFSKVLQVLGCGSLNKSRNRSLSIYFGLFYPMISCIQSELSALRVTAYLDRLSDRRSFFIAALHCGGWFVPLNNV